MTTTTKLRETPGVATTAVGTTGLQECDRWNDLLADLRKGPWINVDIVLKAFEQELRSLKEDSDRDRSHGWCLAKLRLALIHAQVQSAPDAYPLKSADATLIEFAKETATYFEIFGRRGRNATDLIHLDSDEYEAIKVICRELASESLKNRSSVQIMAARLPATPRNIFRTQPKSHRMFISEVLMAVDECASGAPMRPDVMRDLWPTLQHFGRNKGNAAGIDLPR